MELLFVLLYVSVVPTIFSYLNCIISDPNPSFCPKALDIRCPDSSKKYRGIYFKAYLWWTALLVLLNKETQEIINRNFCRFPLIWGLELWHLLISDQLLSQSYFLSITSASSLCFWYLRSWDYSQVTNDDVCTHSSVPVSWSLTHWEMLQPSEIRLFVFFGFGIREERPPALIWDFNIWFGSIFWLSQAHREDKSLDMHLVL